MRKNKILEINYFMYIFFNIMILTLSIDYFTYFLNLKYILSFILSAILIIPFNYLALKKIALKRTIEKLDVIFFILLFLIMAITIMYPDRSFDTFNYHLYLQENPFGNKINFDFFAGKNLNSFSYAFPDRMFYLFRYFLGYRLGVILNYLIIIILYYQVKDILKKIIPKITPLILVILGTLIVTSISLIDILDSYYVDLISAVLLLEVVRITVFKKLDEKENNTCLFAYISLLYGFAFASKISNAILLVFFFLVYIVKNKNIIKCLNIKNILVVLISFLLPFILYFIYTLVETGNPVFPFYNTIFQSKYYSNTNWLDTRFGPSRIREIFYWPFVILFDASRCDDINIVEPIWGYGYFIAILYTIYYLYKKWIKKEKINSTRLSFFIVTILSYILWAKFQLGYSRYGLVILILGSITTYTFIVDCIKKMKIIIIAILLPLMLYHFSYMGSNFMYLTKDWIYNNYYNNVSEYGYNIKNIFAKGNDTNLEFEKDSIWGIIYYNAGLAQIINNEIPIVNVIASASNTYTQELLETKMNQASHIYTLTDSLDFENFITNLNHTTYKITKVKKVLTSNILGNKTDFVYVFEIEDSKNKDTNNFEIFETEKEYSTVNKKNIHFFLGLAKDTNNTYLEDFQVDIIGIKNGEEKILDQIKINKEGEMKELNYSIEEYDTIKIVSQDQENNKIIGNWMMILNVEIK